MMNQKVSCLTYAMAFVLIFAMVLLAACSGNNHGQTVPGPQTSRREADVDPSQTEKNESGNTGGSSQTSSGEVTSDTPQTNPPAPSGLDSLSNEGIDWWFGGNYDALNRPAHPLEEQKKYGKYDADFIFSDVEDKIIYLTLDEGYEAGYTGQILDVLQEKNVQVVFFVTLPYVKDCPDLVKRMIDEGHTVGNHSVNHPSKGLPSQTLEQQTEEVMGVHRYMLENFGYEMNLFRYPAGKYSEQSLALLQSLGYRTVFWSFAYYDYDTAKQPDEAESLEKLVNRLHPGAIYLLHAVSSTNTNILGDFIDRARAEGYTFAAYPA